MSASPLDIIHMKYPLAFNAMIERSFLKPLLIHDDIPFDGYSTKDQIL